MILSSIHRRTEVGNLVKILNDETGKITANMCIMKLFMDEYRSVSYERRGMKVIFAKAEERGGKLRLGEQKSLA